MEITFTSTEVASMQQVSLTPMEAVAQRVAVTSWKAPNSLTVTLTLTRTLTPTPTRHDPPPGHMVKVY